MLLVLTVCFAGPTHAADPVATVFTNWDDIEVDLLSVERKGSVLTVKWAVRSGGEDTADVRFYLVGNSANTYVLDEESGTKYYVLTDEEGNSVASMHEWVASDTHGISTKVKAGQTKRFWAKFPAPPAEIQEVSVFLTSTEPLEDVAIVDR